MLRNNSIDIAGTRVCQAVVLIFHTAFFLALALACLLSVALNKVCGGSSKNGLGEISKKPAKWRPTKRGGAVGSIYGIQRCGLVMRVHIKSPSTSNQRYRTGSSAMKCRMVPAFDK